MNIIENLSIADNKGKRYGLGRGINKARINDYREMLRELNLGLEDKMDIPVGSLSRTEAGARPHHGNAHTYRLPDPR